MREADSEARGGRKPMRPNKPQGDNRNPWKRREEDESLYSNQRQEGYNQFQKRPRQEYTGKQYSAWEKHRGGAPMQMKDWSGQERRTQNDDYSLGQFKGGNGGGRDKGDYERQQRSNWSQRNDGFQGKEGGGWNSQKESHWDEGYQSFDNKYSDPSSNQRFDRGSNFSNRNNNDNYGNNRYQDRYWQGYGQDGYDNYGNYDGYGGWEEEEYNRGGGAGAHHGLDQGGSNKYNQSQSGNTKVADNFGRTGAQHSESGRVGAQGGYNPLSSQNYNQAFSGPGSEPSNSRSLNNPLSNQRFPVIVDNQGKQLAKPEFGGVKVEKQNESASKDFGPKKTPSNFIKSQGNSSLSYPDPTLSTQQGTNNFNNNHFNQTIYINNPGGANAQPSHPTPTVTVDVQKQSPQLNFALPNSIGLNAMAPQQVYFNQAAYMQQLQMQQLYQAQLQQAQLNQMMMAANMLAYQQYPGKYYFDQIIAAQTNGGNCMEIMQNMDSNSQQQLMEYLQANPQLLDQFMSQMMQSQDDEQTEVEDDNEGDEMDERTEEQEQFIQFITLMKDNGMMSEMDFEVQKAMLEEADFEREQELEEKLDPEFASCDCCKGFTKACQGVICKSLGVCHCAMRKEKELEPRADHYEPKAAKCSCCHGFTTNCRGEFCIKRGLCICMGLLKMF